MVRACFSQKTSLITMIGLTTSFFLAEIIVGYATNSMALVADSFHMLSDVVSLFVGFFALKISQQKHRHNLGKNTFGWVRAEVLGALVNSVFLVALCFSILVESLKRMVSPEGISRPLLVLSIGVAGLLVNLLGICIFQGHMGHGHSHGGHSHSHGGHAHGAGESKNGQITIEPSLTTVVIVNEPAMKKTNLELPYDPTDESISSSEANDGIEEITQHRVHSTPSRYQMGIMLAAIQAEESAGQQEVADVEADPTSQKVANKKIKSSDQMNIKGVYLHILGDALGSVIVIISALAIYFGKGKWTLYIDPAMSIFMVGIILKSSLPLLKESSMVLLQTVPTHIQIQELEEKLLGNFPAIVSVHEFHVWQLAGSKIVASLHVKLPSRGDYMGISEKIKTFFHDEGIHSTTIQPEFLEEIEMSDRKSPCLLKCVSVGCRESVCCKPTEESDATENKVRPEQSNDATRDCSDNETIKEASDQRDQEDEVSKL